MRCKRCNNIFTKQYFSQKYCSKKCYLSGYKKRTYILTRLNQSIERINQRLVNEKWHKFCEFCNKIHTEGYVIHHIVFRSEKPKHKEIHNIDNLLLVWIDCHTKLHNQKNIRNPIVVDRNLIKLFWDDIVL
jgi:hypothetical protein